jgi:hypothetical protein
VRRDLAGTLGWEDTGRAEGGNEPKIYESENQRNETKNNQD